MITLLTRIHRWSFFLTAVVVAVDVLFLATGVLTPRSAVVLFLAVELPALLIVAGAAMAVVVMHVRAGATVRRALQEVAAQSPAWPVIRGEVRALRALATLALGRVSAVPQGARIFRADRGRLVMPIAFVVATAVEVVVLHLLIPWPWLQIALAAGSAWSVLALSGWFAVARTHPHYLTDDELVLRQQGEVVATVRRCDVATVRRRTKFSVVTPTLDDDGLHLPNPDGTVVDIVLRVPVQACLPSLFPGRCRVGEVTRISLYLDDPKALCAEFLDADHASDRLTRSARHDARRADGCRHRP